MAEDGGLVELAGAHQAVKERVASQKMYSIYIHICIISAGNAVWTEVTEVTEAG